MNVIGSSGWLEYFTDGKNANLFAPPISDADNLIVPTICIYEVFKRLLAEQDEDSDLLSVGLMSYGGEVELIRNIAIEKAYISRELKLGMADSILLATTRAYEATLWTQVVHFKDLEGVMYIEQK